MKLNKYIEIKRYKNFQIELTQYLKDNLNDKLNIGYLECRQKITKDGIKGTVMASKLMGSFSSIHLSVLNDNNEVVHVHSHMPPEFNPQQSSAVEIEIDQSQAFIFKN